MTYLHLAYLHLATVLPAFLLDTYLMLNPKGTPLHKKIGKLYLSLMFATGIITLMMSAKVGPTLWGHFGFLHLFSLNVLCGVPVAYWAARKGDIKTHRANMLGLYVFGLLLAGSFALMPGRLLHKWLFA